MIVPERTEVGAGHRWRHRLRALMPAAISVGLLFGTTASDLNRSGDVWRNEPKRLWEDQALAVGTFLTGEFPVAYKPFRKERYASGPRYTEPRGLLRTSSSARTGTFGSTTDA
jgi:hypothetical protein